MMDAEWIEDFVTAVTSLGVEVLDRGVSTDTGHDLSIIVRGSPAKISLTRAGTVTSSTVSALLANRESPEEPTDSIPVLVGERILEQSRRLLRQNGWSWLDLRGHLHLEGPGILVDTDVEPLVARPERSDAFAGLVGLEVAALLLLQPDEEPGVRSISRKLNRSASTISEVLKALRNEGLLTRPGRPDTRDLFWRLAGSWNTPAASLASLPAPGDGSVNKALRLGLQDPESTTGWAMTDTMAAALYGAPIGVRADYPPDFYVPTEAAFSRAIRLLGRADNPADRKCSIRVAPITMACELRVDAAQRQLGNEHWPLAHPLFVALDLAADPGRGNEILEGWNPPEPWQRVW
ncbi:winged helix DNA-binding protein [Actinomadura bangladeshensis]|nr:winged helix DNA-binding protein [Actinomadura bangladeshensis]